MNNVTKPPSVLRLGTRGSLLARAQSQMIAAEIERRNPGVKVELVLCTTTGDSVADRPLHEFGGKGLFTKELEEALLRREVDFAVHSFKDVPVTMPLVDQSELMLAAVPAREDPRDCLICGVAKSLKDLPRGAVVGTGSLRRGCQIRALRSDLEVRMIRGNIDTRLRKQREGEFDAVVLAMAGLVRAGLFDARDMTAIPAEEMLPAAAQGALALQCRKDNAGVREILAKVNDATAGLCTEMERAVVFGLKGDCHSPIAALARVDGMEATLEVAVGAAGGGLPVLRAGAGQSVLSANKLPKIVLRELIAQGVEAVLHPKI